MVSKTEMEAIGLARESWIDFRDNMSPYIEAARMPPLHDSPEACFKEICKCVHLPLAEMRKYRRYLRSAFRYDTRRNRFLRMSGEDCIVQPARLIGAMLYYMFWRGIYRAILSAISDAMKEGCSLTDIEIVGRKALVNTAKRLIPTIILRADMQFGKKGMEHLAGYAASGIQLGRKCPSPFLVPLLARNYPESTLRDALLGQTYTEVFVWKADLKAAQASGDRLAYASLRDITSLRNRILDRIVGEHSTVADEFRQRGRKTSANSARRKSGKDPIYLKQVDLDDVDMLACRDSDVDTFELYEMAFGALAPRQRQIAELWLIEGYDTNGIARILNIKPSTVYNTRPIIRHKVAEALGWDTSSLSERLRLS